MHSVRKRTAVWSRALPRVQPAMSYLRRLAEKLTAAGPSIESPERLRQWILGWSAAELRDLRSEPAKIARRAASFFPRGSVIVTWSRSSTVRTFLEALPRSHRPARILVPPSEPGDEGRELARELRRAGLPIRSISDGDAVERLAGPKAVLLLGADSIYSDGTLLHKIGTRSLASAARRLGRPVLVLAGRSKFHSGRVPARLPPPFDSTPFQSGMTIWTDQGQWRPKGSKAPRTRSFAASVGRATWRALPPAGARPVPPRVVRASGARGRRPRAKGPRPESPPQ